jgi:hypothetical protein
MKLTVTAAATLAIAGSFGGLAACGSHTVKPPAAKPPPTHTAAALTRNSRSVPGHTAKPAALVGQAEVGRLLAADKAAIASAPGGTNAMKASYLVNAINDQRPAWNAVLNMPGLSASAHTGITDWLAFVNQIQAYHHGKGRDRVRVLATGVRAEEELTNAYPQLSALLPR